MKNVAIALFVLASAAGIAHAEDNGMCGNTPKDKWLTEDAVKAKAEKDGYEVRKVKIEDGCYELYAVDAKGAKVEMLVNPGSGEVVGTEDD